METLRTLLDFVRHLDQHLGDLTRNYGVWTYAILAAIIFCETGLVVTPFLPGDSLLFASGAIVASLGTLDIGLLTLILIVAAVIGDAVNYHIGKTIGPRVMSSETSRWLNKKHLQRTEQFFDKYGGKTIIIARFVPIVRTFAPFVAGAGSMTYRRFVIYNIVGAILWVTICLFAGFFFGNMPIIKKNFELVVLGIIAVSLMPAVIEFLRARRGGAEDALAKQ